MDGWSQEATESADVFDPRVLQVLGRPMAEREGMMAGAARLTHHVFSELLKGGSRGGSRGGSSSTGVVEGSSGGGSDAGSVITDRILLLDPELLAIAQEYASDGELFREERRAEAHTLTDGLADEQGQTELRTE